jgi:Bacteriophage tail sheath protein
MIDPLPTSITAFVGFATAGPANEPTLIRSFAEFTRTFGGLSENSTLSLAVEDYFLNGGREAIVVRGATGADGDPSVEALVPPAQNGTGLYALDSVDLFNLLCLPPIVRGGDVPTGALSAASAYCSERHALLIVDSHSSWHGLSDVAAGANSLEQYAGLVRQNAAIYFPRIMKADLLHDGALASAPISGAVAGVIARTDVERGVWRAPAGQDAALRGIRGLSDEATSEECKALGSLGVNCVRSLPDVGTVVWGARTMEGADSLGSEWKYIPVRRTALFLEESLYRGTRWVVFEENDEPLWAQIRLEVEAFMHGLFEEGAFQATTPDRAYFVKCDADTTTKYDIDRGIVNIVVGFAPLKPAEFVVIKIQQIATSVGIGASASVSSGLDPYASFRFRVMWQGRYVAGATKLGGLKRTSEIVKDNQSLTASQQRAAQRSKYEAITLERGVTHDREFENWASEVAETEDAAGSNSSRRAILIKEYDEAGHFVQSYRLVRAWVSEFEASPDLDASANAVAIDTIKLENEGWRRDVVCEG